MNFSLFKLESKFNFTKAIRPPAAASPQNDLTRGLFVLPDLFCHLQAIEFRRLAGSDVSCEEKGSRRTACKLSSRLFVSGNDHAFPYMSGQSWNQSRRSVKKLASGCNKRVLFLVRLALIVGLIMIGSPPFAADSLLIVDVYARIVPQGVTEPIPDPFIEAIVSGQQKSLPPDVQQLQSKAFQIKSGSGDFQAVIPGVEGQRIELSFTAAVLPNGQCAVTDFQLGAASESSSGNALPSESSQTMNRGGFAVAPGQRVPQWVSTQSGAGAVFYYLIFSAAKGVVE